MIRGVLAVMVILASAAFGATIPVNSGWQSFTFGDVGTVNNFDYTSGGPVSIRVTDGYVIGDEFSVSLDGGAGVPTSAIALGDDGVQSGAADGDTAWADPRLSHLEMSGGAGFHTIDVTHTRNALGFTGGGAFIRVDERADVPEPGTLVLLGLGLSAAAVIRRRAV